MTSPFATDPPLRLRPLSQGTGGFCPLSWKTHAHVDQSRGSSASNPFFSPAHTDQRDAGHLLKWELDFMVGTHLETSPV